MPALSPVKKENVEWVQKKTRLLKREDRVHGSATKKKKLKHTIKKYFFLKF
jgi:hypothetical protein